MNTYWTISLRHPGRDSWSICTDPVDGRHRFTSHEVASLVAKRIHSTYVAMFSESPEMLLVEHTVVEHRFKP